jgi:hypothetical protein
MKSYDNAKENTRKSQVLTFSHHRTFFQSGNRWTPSQNAFKFITNIYKNSEESRNFTVAHTCNLSYSRDQKDREIRSQAGQIIQKTLSQKYPTWKRAGKMVQVSSCLEIVMPWVQIPVHQKKRENPKKTIHIKI